MSWQLQEAKSKFSELVRRTLEEGPQTITRHGREAVVMISDEEYRRLAGEEPGTVYEAAPKVHGEKLASEMVLKDRD